MKCEDCGHDPCDCDMIRWAHEQLYGEEERQLARQREDIARVQELFFQKLAAKYPNHPWTQRGERR